MGFFLYAVVYMTEDFKIKNTYTICILLFRYCLLQMKKRLFFSFTGFREKCSLPGISGLCKCQVSMYKYKD